MTPHFGFVNIKTDNTSAYRVRQMIWSLLSLLFMVFIVRSLVVSPYKIPSGSMIPTLLVGDQIVVPKFRYGFCRFSLLASRYIYYFSGRIFCYKLPSRGDVVVFTCPHNTSLDYVKRVVGVEGDEVQMIKGRLHVNGKELPLKEIETDYKAHEGHKYISGTVYEEELPIADVANDGTVKETNKVCKHKMLKMYPFGSHSDDHTPAFKVPPAHFFFMGDNRDGSSDSRRELGFVHKDYLLGNVFLVFLSFNEHMSWWNPLTWWHVRPNRFFHLISETQEKENAPSTPSKTNLENTQSSEETRPESDQKSTS